MPQAYRKELEREVAHLKEENAKLREHQKKVSVFVVPKEEMMIFTKKKKEEMMNG